MSIILIRYVLPALVIIGLSLWVGSIIHNNGRTVEREVWQKIIIEERAEAQLALNIAREEIEEEAHQQQLDLAGVINEKAEKIKNLNSDLHDATNRKLYIAAKSCPDNTNTLPGTTSNSVKPTSATSRVELPAKITKRLRRSYQLAQETVILYQTCLGVVKAANVEIIYPVGEKND